LTTGGRRGRLKDWRGNKTPTLAEKRDRSWTLLGLVVRREKWGRGEKIGALGKRGESLPQRKKIGKRFKRGHREKGRI